VYAAPADSYGGTSVPARMGEAFQTQHTAASARSLEANGARAPASTKVVPILVAFVAVLLVSGAIAAIVVLGKKSGDQASLGTPGASSASATPSDSPTSVSSASTSAPTDTSAPSATAQADASTAPVEVTLACDPTCDEIKVDDQPLADLTKPAQLAPGKHTVAL